MPPFLIIFLILNNKKGFKHHGYLKNTSLSSAPLLIKDGWLKTFSKAHVA